MSKNNTSRKMRKSAKRIGNETTSAQSVNSVALDGLSGNLTDEPAKKSSFKEKLEELYVFFVCAGIFIALWVSAGMLIWHKVVEAGGNEAMAWTAAIIGGFIAAVICLVVAWFFMGAAG